MSESTKRLTSQELKSELSGFYGAEDLIYKCPVGEMVYTPGARYFFRNGGQHGSYWLRDILMTQPELFQLYEDGDFAVLTIDVNDSKTTITVSEDTESQEINDKIIRAPTGKIWLRMDIEYTDLQAGQWSFYIENSTLMLPSER